MPLVSMCGDEGVEKKKTGISQSWSRYEQTRIIDVLSNLYGRFTSLSKFLLHVKRVICSSMI